MNLLHYLPYLMAFMVITAVVYAWGLYRAQTADRDDQALLESKGASRIRRALRKKGPMTRAQLRPVVEGLTASRPFSQRRIAVTDPDQFLDALLPYLVEQRFVSVRKERGTELYELRK